MPRLNCDLVVSSPYSYNCKRIPKDAEDQIEAAMGAAKAIKNAHGTAFTVSELIILAFLIIYIISICY